VILTVRCVLHRQNGLGRRPRHQQQDDEWNDGPDDLDRRVLVELLGDVTFRLAMRVDRIAHRAEDDEEDDDADPENDRVQLENLVRDRRDRRRQVPLAIGPCRARCQRRNQ
jgi:hypothetical protein